MGQRGGIDTGGLGCEWKGGMGAAGRHRPTGGRGQWWFLNMLVTVLSLRGGHRHREGWDMNGRGIWGQRGGIDTEGWVRMEGGNGGSGEASTHRGACVMVIFY